MIENKPIMMAIPIKGMLMTMPTKATSKKDLLREMTEDPMTKTPMTEAEATIDKKEETLARIDLAMTPEDKNLRSLSVT